MKDPSSNQKTELGTMSNLVLFGLFFMLVFVLSPKNSGYRWVKEKFIQSNLKIIKQYPHLSKDEKIEAKFGFDLRYINFLKKNIPDTGIILVPPKEIIAPKGGKSDFRSPYMSEKAWLSYFLYPRKVIFEDEQSALYDRATHIAVMNGWGYEKVPSKITNKQRNSIIKINR